MVTPLEFYKPNFVWEIGIGPKRFILNKMAAYLDITTLSVSACTLLVSGECNQG